MKILFIARTCPYPANDGERIRVYNIIKNMSHHDVTLVYRSMTPADKEGIHELNKYCKHVYPAYIPSPNSGFQKLKWILPFVFSKYPIGLSTVYFKEVQKIIQDSCEREDFDIIQIEHSSLTIYLDFLRIKNMPKTVLTMHNVDYVRNDRVIENLSFGVDKLYQIFNQMKFKQWEIESLKRYDHVIAMSEVDKQIMLNDAPELDVSIVPNGVDTKAVSFDVSTRLKSHNKKIVFVASMDSEANHDGAMYFIDHVFPLIKQESPDVELYVVGRSPRKELLNKSNDTGIIVTGMVDSVYDYYREAAVSIVPLRSGGGTRLKIFESMAIGVPVVSTTVGAEGINVSSGEDILLADNPENFASAVLELLKNDVLYAGIVKRARSRMLEEYDWGVIAKQHDLVYELLKANSTDSQVSTC